MIDAGIARKLGSDCSHSLPIVVSCIECMQNSLTKWEARIREDHGRTISDEVKQLKETLARTRAEHTKLMEANDALLTVATRAQKDAVTAREQLRDAKDTITSLSAQLHAEQAVRNHPRIVAVNE